MSVGFSQFVDGVCVDYPLEGIMFRAEKPDVWGKPYGSARELSYDIRDKAVNDALRFGDPVSRAVYDAGKPSDDLHAYSPDQARDEHGKWTTEVRAFAVRAHGDQKYGGDKPYVKHLDDVHGVLREYGVTDRDLLTAAYLHDTLEDTHVTYRELADRFGRHVADIVRSVTLIPRWKTSGHAEQHDRTTRERTVKNPLGVKLKLADRIANMRQSVRDKSPKLAMYQREYPAFRSVLYRDEDAPMWRELDRLHEGHL